jgi:DNA-binding MarR family transcriptional regulator
LRHPSEALNTNPHDPEWQTMANTPLSDDETQAWNNLVRAHANIVNAVDKELTTEHSLGLADYDVLSQLAMSEDRSLRMTELAKRVLLSPSGLTRRLDGLVKNGYVERKPCPSDGRGLLAVITDSGIEKLRTMTPTHTSGVRAHFVDIVDNEKLTQLSSALSPIADTTAAAASASASTSSSSSISNHH